MAGVVFCTGGKLACGVQKLSTVPTQNIPSCRVRVWRASARRRRASGARRSRHVALSRSMSAVLLTPSPCDRRQMRQNPWPIGTLPRCQGRGIVGVLRHGWRWLALTTEHRQNG
jgi:hypothetical protein